MQTAAQTDTTGAAAAAQAAAAEPKSLSGTFVDLVDKVEGWGRDIVLLLPNLVIAILIVIAAAFVARVVRGGVRKVMERVTNHAPQAKNVANLIATLAYVVVLAAGTFIALGTLGADDVVTTLLAGAGVVGLALGFAFQDIASNFIAGVLMAVRNPFVVGQIVETNGYMGTVKELTLRSTLIETFQGQTVIIPNAKVFQEPIVNFSATRHRRVDLGCGVGYGDDLEKAERVALEAIEGLDVRNTSRPVQLYYNEFGDSSINFTLRFWVDFSKQTDFLDAQSQAIKALKVAFDQNEITIPFPIRTLDFGPNGGVALSEMQLNTSRGDA
ncbi:mechanosensitive ion channel family protein [Rubricoccus marinus]|uniref:mechanosensitive ion channel family protein n=1 Tax=Rubricoccus marinus TaxID=716817 RepID=UPI000B987D51|nr:mechanosensitive ion channel family protein [Rubricoccus marinus]